MIPTARIPGVPQSTVGRMITLLQGIAALQHFLFNFKEKGTTIEKFIAVSLADNRAESIVLFL
ncbi:MAG: hypothetical protein M0Q92_14580 [Methanoregula sp.]|jgi:hypothetical protein|nr:hypothetical protein [Methanoregula sp.]